MQRVRHQQELTQWVCDTLGMESLKFDDLKNGVALVQLVHSIAPHTFDLGRVDFLASTPYHFEKNLKILQEVMPLAGIRKDFIIERLAEGEKQRDLMIFLAYMRLHYDTFKRQAAYSFYHAQRGEPATKALLHAAGSSGLLSASSSSSHPSIPAATATAAPQATSSKPPLHTNPTTAATAITATGGTTNNSTTSLSNSLATMFNRDLMSASDPRRQRIPAVSVSINASSSNTHVNGGSNARDDVPEIPYDAVAERRKAQERRKLRMGKTLGVGSSSASHTKHSPSSSVPRSDGEEVASISSGNSARSKQSALSAISTHSTMWMKRLIKQRLVQCKPLQPSGGIERWASDVETPADAVEVLQSTHGAATGSTPRQQQPTSDFASSMTPVRPQGLASNPSATTLADEHTATPTAETTTSFGGTQQHSDVFLASGSHHDSSLLISGNSLSGINVNPAAAAGGGGGSSGNRGRGGSSVEILGALGNSPLPAANGSVSPSAAATGANGGVTPRGGINDGLFSFEVVEELSANCSFWELDKWPAAGVLNNAEGDAAVLHTWNRYFSLDELMKLRNSSINEQKENHNKNEAVGCTTDESAAAKKSVASPRAAGGGDDTETTSRSGRSTAGEAAAKGTAKPPATKQQASAAAATTLCFNEWSDFDDLVLQLN